VGYLDLYLMHWPVAFNPIRGPLLDKSVTIAETWAAMEELVRANLTRFIGISNFAHKDVVDLLEVADIKPYAHEFETHPYLQQQAFVDYHRSIGIKVIAYSPLANTNPIYKSKIRPILDDPFWIGVAAKKKISVAQAVLGWGLARGTVIIPKSVTEGFIAENRGALQVGFSGEEMRVVEGQDKRARMNDPSESWGVELFGDLDGGGEGGEGEAEL
jgi:alcohol dehydrogenase (NADP+)